MKLVRKGSWATSGTCTTPAREPTTAVLKQTGAVTPTSTGRDPRPLGPSYYGSAVIGILDTGIRTEHVISPAG